MTVFQLLICLGLVTNICSHVLKQISAFDNGQNNPEQELSQSESQAYQHHNSPWAANNYEDMFDTYYNSPQTYEENIEPLLESQNSFEYDPVHPRNPIAPTDPRVDLEFQSNHHHHQINSQSHQNNPYSLQDGDNERFSPIFYPGNKWESQSNMQYDGNYQSVTNQEQFPEYKLEFRNPEGFEDEINSYLMNQEPHRLFATHQEHFPEYKLRFRNPEGFENEINSHLMQQEYNRLFAPKLPLLADNPENIDKFGYRSGLYPGNSDVSLEEQNLSIERTFEIEQNNLNRDSNLNILAQDGHLIFVQNSYEPYTQNFGTTVLLCHVPSNEDNESTERNQEPFAVNWHPRKFSVKHHISSYPEISTAKKTFFWPTLLPKPTKEPTSSASTPLNTPIVDLNTPLKKQIIPSVKTSFTMFGTSTTPSTLSTSITPPKTSLTPSETSPTTTKNLAADTKNTLETKKTPTSTTTVSSTPSSASHQQNTTAASSTTTINSVDFTTVPETTIPSIRSSSPAITQEPIIIYNIDDDVLSTPKTFGDNSNSEDNNINEYYDVPAE